MTNRDPSALGLYAALTAGLAVLFLLNLVTGSVAIGPVEAIRILAGGEASRASWETIIWLFRLPKAITAVFAGAGLAMSGLFMQTLFRNPLAGPSVLGITAGASFGVALVVLAGAGGGAASRFIEGLGLYGQMGLVLASGLGAAGVMAIILLLARRVEHVMTLLIVGLLAGFAINAAVSVLIHFSVAELIQAYVAWTFGSFGAAAWSDLRLFVPIMAAGVLAGQSLRKPLNGLLLGEDYARSMGLGIFPLRIAVIGLTALLTGTVTAFCGPVAFIGVAVPHLARAVMNSSDHRRLLPAVVLLGGMTALAADLVAQFPGSDAVLPLNAVTALIGAPVIVWFILRRRNLQKTFAN
ncbi:MAG: iron chelate uptake ABC transporter family permease subunit [Desulfococcaceae bacterium]